MFGTSFLHPMFWSSHWFWRIFWVLWNLSLSSPSFKTNIIYIYIYSYSWLIRISLDIIPATKEFFHLHINPTMFMPSFIPSLRRRVPHRLWFGLQLMPRKQIHGYIPDGIWNQFLYLGGGGWPLVRMLVTTKMTLHDWVKHVKNNKKTLMCHVFY